ncbi:Orotate phosphoribosyltransferase [Pichia kudriavzevii]|uniref:Orotate phosphoribosyltransferase n=1 Tax=Pichia kudriavzevii TaxID=4909 RepID=A0A1V2LMN9_PICKU|nr:Orotate phosphoribosyltransferase [Pichia kudriavzevii]
MPSYKETFLQAALDAEALKFGTFNIPYSSYDLEYNGEGGSIVGCNMKGKKILIIDDVMTAGTAINEAFGIISAEGGNAVGCIIALDRMETTKDSNDSATNIVAKRYGVPVFSIVCFDDIIEVLKDQLSEEQMEKINEYRKQYVPAK